jgi:hypothetical protein
LLARTGVKVLAFTVCDTPYTFGKTKRCIDEAYGIKRLLLPNFHILISLSFELQMRSGMHHLELRFV